MIMNSSVTSTLQHHHSIELVHKPISITDISRIDYDALGAIAFIVVVVSWYAMSVFCMLLMQIRAHNKTVEDCVNRRTKLFIQTLRDQTQRKEILEELANKQKRDKLWSIYFGKLDINKDKLKRAERIRIRNIEKQLAKINHTRMIINETVTTPVTKCFIRRSLSDSRSTFISHHSTIENQSNDQRRSSLDQQAIEKWKSIAGQNKTLEQFPWAIKKMHILRYFRRAYKNSSKDKTIPMTDSPPNREHLDDEQCHLISPEKVTHNQSRPLRKKSNDLLNPYITYFHLPINENLITNIQNNLPLVTITSDHHIIQMNDDKCQC